MGAYDFMMNMSQESRLIDQEKEIAQLKEKVDLLKEWVDYLNIQIEELKNEKASNCSKD